MSYPMYLVNRFEYIFHHCNQQNMSKPKKQTQHRKKKKVRFNLQKEYIFYTEPPENID